MQSILFSHIKYALEEDWAPILRAKLPKFGERPRK